MNSAVSITNVTKRFDRLKALDDVTFEVPLRSIFGLLGPNGAGKTTLFSITANFLRANSGGIEVLGIDTRRISQLRGRLSILPQDAQFQRNVPILEQLIFFRLLDGQTKQQAHSNVMETLELVGLESVAKRRVGALSHGMVKRLGIAQAFLGRPEVILLDEPTSGLDPANARQVRDLIKQLQQSATIIVSSHNMAEIQELCDHVAILDQGKLRLADSVDAITLAGREYNLVLSRPLQEHEADQLLSINAVRQIKKSSETFPTTSAGQTPYLVKLDLSQNDTDLDEVLAALLRHLLDMGITPRKLTEGRSLETHFLEITGSAL